MQQSHNLSGDTLCEQLMVCLGANFLDAAIVKNRAALIPASLDLSR